MADPVRNDRDADTPDGSGPDQDPEAGWPPRFSGRFIGLAAFLLVLLFVAVSGMFVSVYESADLFEGDDAAENVAAFVLVIIGLLLITGGVLFSLIEAKKPPPA